MRKVLVVLLALVLIGAGGVAFADAWGGGPSYRTATASVGDVEQTLSLSGTISPAGLTDLSFATDGKVVSVGVHQGEQVYQDQVLARLEARSLRMALTDARTGIARARASLASDETAQAAAVTAAERAARAKKAAKKAQHPGGSSDTGGSASGPDPVLAELAQEQRAVLDAQTAATNAIATAKTDLEAEVQACTPTASPSDSPSDSSSDSGTSPGDDCSAALQTVQSDQDAVATAQDALQQALTQLSETLTKAIASLGQTGGSGSDGTGSSGNHTKSTPSSPASSTDPNGSSTGSSFGGATVTAAQLARDQSSIDAAKAGLVAATQSLRQASLRAPYAGRIVAVDVARGDSASTGATAFVLVARGVTTVSTSLNTSQIDEVKVGQTVRVTPSGASERLTGRVSAIGLLPNSSASSSSTAYSVTITLDQRALSIPAGATASVAVVIGTARHVVTVPTSAVTRAGQAVVEVLEGGKVTVTPVTVGVVGLTSTQIKSGLTAGQKVVLANVSEAVPSNNTGNGFIRFGGGFPAGVVRQGNGGPVSTVTTSR